MSPLRAGDATDTGAPWMRESDVPCVPGVAGHEGLVSFYKADGLGMSGAPPTAPFWSFKAHKGWIGDLQFCSQAGDGQCTRMLTASNDKTYVAATRGSPPAHPRQPTLASPPSPARARPLASLRTLCGMFAGS